MINNLASGLVVYETPSDNSVVNGDLSSDSSEGMKSDLVENTNYSVVNDKIIARKEDNSYLVFHLFNTFKALLDSGDEKDMFMIDLS